MWKRFLVSETERKSDIKGDVESKDDSQYKK